MPPPVYSGFSPPLSAETPLVTYGGALPQALFPPQARELMAGESFFFSAPERTLMCVFPLRRSSQGAYFDSGAQGTKPITLFPVAAHSPKKKLASSLKR